MRRIRASLAVSFILGTATASAQAQQKPFGYLIDAANQIKQIEYAHAVVTREGNARIAKLACDALTRLSHDDQLRVAVNEVSRNTDANRGAAGRLLENLAEFNASFLPAEADLMRSQDLDYAAIVDVLQVALKTRTTTKVGGLTQEAIIASINRGREQVCQFAAAAVSDRQRAQAT